MLCTLGGCEYMYMYTVCVCVRACVHAVIVCVYMCMCAEHHHLFHVTMEISVHSVENIPRYTADTVGVCDNLVYYLVMHTHVNWIAYSPHRDPNTATLAVRRPEGAQQPNRVSRQQAPF